MNRKEKTRTKDGTAYKSTIRGAQVPLKELSSSGDEFDRNSKKQKNRLEIYLLSLFQNQ